MASLSRRCESFWPGGRRRACSRVCSGVGVCLAVLVVSILSACDGTGSGQPAAEADTAQDERPNIVLIVLDTVRRDHLSCYGYERETSPVLEELAQSSTTYLNAYSTSCWTIPAHASLFTGLYPSTHGAVTSSTPLADGFVTLAEALRTQGYRSAGISENIMLQRGNGFAQGFQTYAVVSTVHDEPEDKAVALFREALNQEATQPLFIFVNLCGPHAPYSSSGQFFGQFLSDPDYADECLQASSLGVALGKYKYTANDLVHLAEHYDAEIRYADYQVGQMIEALKSKGLWDNTVLIVTADHGEALGEHGLLGHQFSLWEQTVQIPLLIRYPKSFPPGSQDGRTVQLPDVAVTLFDLAGARSPTYGVQGRSLLLPAPDTARPVFCEYSFHLSYQVAPALLDDPRLVPYKRDLQSLMTGGIKLIQASDGDTGLFDLATDTGESSDLANVEDHRVRARSIEQTLVETAAKYAPTEKHPRPTVREKTLSADKLKEMQSLLEDMGYL